MCGIVVYYGDAENSLTRILTGMWAIIYRAPDSTGIGMLGSETEPLRIRRSLGSVENLIDLLMDAPLFDEQEVRAMAALADDGTDHARFIARQQGNLLAHEGFKIQKSPDYPSWADLTDTDTCRTIPPGTQGNPVLAHTFPIDGPKSLTQTIHTLVGRFDLPLAVVEKLVFKGFREQVEKGFTTVGLPVAREELFQEFRQIFDRFAHGEGPARPKRGRKQGAPKSGQKNPLARKYTWQLLRRVHVILPTDFTTDGIANLFRHLDSRVLAGRSNDTTDRIQVIFENFWNAQNSTPPKHWHTLYRAEKACNLFGLAAASAMAWFQTEVYMKAAAPDPNPDQAPAPGLPPAAPQFLPTGHVPGPTHPLLLRYMANPVVGQGRWAIQSAISVRNAHPFTDWNRERAVVLNGQFDSGVESRIKDYITRVLGLVLRTDNSTELFSILWGYYFDTVYTESRRYKTIQAQHDLGLEELSICSQSIDYTVFKNYSNRSIHDIDELAFIKAVEAMIPSGGQFAVSGISRVSPDRLFLATHKRPVYIVRRRDTNEFMVVSDINAALGLFPQSLIQETRAELRRLMKAYAKKSVIVEPDFFDNAPTGSEDWYRQKKQALLAPFQVDIYALDRETTFARIRTRPGQDKILRELAVMDFSGNRRRDIRPEKTVLTPVSFQKDFGSTFYEEHLAEIPGLILDGLNRYTDPATGLPRFDIRRRLLERRFGTGLAKLNRIILVSTGFSFTLAEIVEKTMEQFFTGINIVVAGPQDISRVETAVNPDRDLVVMISWSGTTSDMIDAASLLLKAHILMVGVTEKPFSDLALVTRRSGGVIPVLSGEEVTVAPLKSAVLMLLTLDLFCLCISGATRNGNTATSETVAGLTGEMREFPEKIAALLSDRGVAEFCKQAAKAGQDADRHYILDAFHDVGAAKTAALNLELNTWTSMGNALDYAGLADFLATPLSGDDLILVNATSQNRLAQALAVMKALKASNRPFFAVTFPCRELSEIEALAEQTVTLPKVSDCFQPFIDLPFMFLLGFYYGLARGRMAGEMPRNMAKSVTAGRTKNSGERSPAQILDDLDRKRAAVGTMPEEDEVRDAPLCWINLATDGNESKYYRDLVSLSQIFHASEPFDAMFRDSSDSSVSSDSVRGEALQNIFQLITQHLAEDGILILVPMDRQAEAGCRNFIHLWDPFLNIPLQVEFPEKIKGVSTEDSLVVAVASEAPDAGRLAHISRHAHENLVWIGPEDPNGPAAFETFSSSFGAWYFKNPGITCRHELVYAGLTLFFSRVMAQGYPAAAKRFNAHFKLLLPLVRNILDNATLRRRIQKAILENREYGKQLFVTGFRGNEISWKTGIGPRNPVGVESESFGDSAYHHLVLVDPAAGEKFVAVEPRETMLARYPEKDIRAWENRYLAGADVDEFLETASMPFHADAVLPFMIDNQWFLPVLRPGYNPGRDCLIIIDATSETRFDAALDELATFGSRYARIIVITQEGFASDARLANLKKYPLSHILLLPGLPETSGNAGIISDFLLPVVVNLVGAAVQFLNPR